MLQLLLSKIFMFLTFTLIFREHYILNRLVGRQEKLSVAKRNARLIYNESLNLAPRKSFSKISLAKLEGVPSMNTVHLYDASALDLTR